MPSVVPPSCESLFRAASWFPCRQVSVDLRGLSELKSHEAALALLFEFGGLHVGNCGPEHDCATSDIRFFSRASAGDRYSVAERTKFADDLFPLGKGHREHMELFLGASGRLYAYGMPDGSLQIVAATFVQGVEKLLLGHRFDGWRPTA